MRFEYMTNKYAPRTNVRVNIGNLSAIGAISIYKRFQKYASTQMENRVEWLIIMDVEFEEFVELLTMYERYLGDKHSVHIVTEIPAYLTLTVR